MSSSSDVSALLVMVLEYMAAFPAVSRAQIIERETLSDNIQDMLAAIEIETTRGTNGA